MADWELERLDTHAVHEFEAIPETIPSVEYQQLVTEHILLDGTIKQDKSSKIPQTLLIAWPKDLYISTTERETLEGLAKLTCLFKLTWKDETGASKNKTGYLMLVSGKAVGHVGYQFGLKLRFSE